MGGVGLCSKVGVLLLLLTSALLLFYPATGDNPSFTECRPHIDATIRNLAAKAIVAGEQPSEDLHPDDYDIDTPEPEPEIPEEPPTPIEPPPPPPPQPKEPEVREEPPKPTPPPPAPKEPEPPVEPPAPEPIREEPHYVEAPAPPPAPKPAPPPEPKPVHYEPPPPPPPRQETKPTAAEKPSGIINKFIDAIFGLPKNGRDPKFAQPWQTHPEFQKRETKEEAPVKKKVDTSPGIIHKFVSIIFGEPSGIRDPKYAEPWQTHKEHKKQPVPQAAEKPKKVDTSPGIIHKFVSLIFGTPSGKRDPKWAEPWQTHKEHKKTVKKDVEEEKTVIHGAMGGPIDKLVKLVFTTVKEGTKRDPKWAEPWQTHPEFAKKGVKMGEEKPKEKEKVIVGASGGLIDKFVKLIFETLPEGTKRDPKWAQPWQTHPEHVSKGASERKPEEPAKKVIVGASGGLIDKLVKVVFETLPAGTKRDPKWAQPWQTHPEHSAKTAKEAPKEAKVVKVEASGGLIDKLVRLVFEVPKDNIPRDPKWAQPWQTHKEHMKHDVSPSRKPEYTAPPPPAPKRPEPAAAPPPPKPEPVTPPKVVEPEVPTPPKQPEPAPAPKVEPAPAPKPAPAPEPKPAPKPEAFPGPSGSPAAAPAGAAKVVDAPPPPRQPVLEQETQKAAPAPPPPPPPVHEEEPIVVPSALRSRDRLEEILGLDQTSQDIATRTQPIAQATLTSLKSIYENTVKPLEVLYKYQDISNRHVSDAELFGTPLVLLVGPYSTGKSSFINYLLGIEYTKRALKTGTTPSLGVFRVIQYGETDSDLDGTAISAQRIFASLQKYGQNFIDQLHGKTLHSDLLKKVTLVEAPGILEMRRPGERLYPYNDVVQWFIDRADLILVMFDYTKLDAGYELEAILDQLKGREAQTRILLNKADQVAAEELIKVQGSLFWNLSPLLGVSSPPTVYAGSFASRPYRSGSPAKLFQAQEEALLSDIALAINARVDNRIAIARRHAVRVRNHAQMVDTYLTTFYRNKGFLTSKHKLAEDIIENPHSYNIYEGISLLTNISRYDLPDPEVYRDFFRVHNLYDFPTLRATCSYFRGCPLTKIDSAISAELPELLERYRRLYEAAIAAPAPAARHAAPVPAPAVRGNVPAAATARTS